MLPLNRPRLDISSGGGSTPTLAGKPGGGSTPTAAGKPLNPKPLPSGGTATPPASKLSLKSITSAPAKTPARKEVYESTFRPGGTLEDQRRATLLPSGTLKATAVKRAPSKKVELLRRFEEFETKWRAEQHSSSSSSSGSSGGGGSSSSSSSGSSSGSSSSGSGLSVEPEQACLEAFAHGLETHELDTLAAFQHEEGVEEDLEEEEEAAEEACTNKALVSTTKNFLKRTERRPRLRVLTQLSSVAGQKKQELALLAMQTLATLGASVPAIPKDLVDDIVEGRCVAFVGAGFSMSAGLPHWGQLLDQLCDQLPEAFEDPISGRCLNLRSDLRAMRAEAEGSLTPDMFASLLKNSFDFVAEHSSSAELRQRYSFARVMQECLRVPGQGGLAGSTSADMRQRLDLLRGIPFRGLITTNFDELLQGRTPFDADIKDTYQLLLRPKAVFRGPFGGPPGGPLQHTEQRPIVQLHGRVGPDWLEGGSGGAAAGAAAKPAAKQQQQQQQQARGGRGLKNPFVFSKSEYSAHIFGNPSNKQFLESLFATTTILFIGFSFTDSYVDSLLDQTVHLFFDEEGKVLTPFSYAINADKFGPVSSSSRNIIKAVRGVEFLLYEHTTDHSNFVKTLEALKKAVDERLKAEAE